jgi:para-aminobenzoate synthetase component 1
MPNLPYMKDLYTLTDTIYASLKSLPGSHLSRDVIILESQHPDHPESTQTFIAAFSDNYLVANGSNIEWYRGSNTRLFESGPWQALEEFRESADWAFGYIGYGTGRSATAKSPVNESYYDAPDLYFMEPAYLFRIDADGIHQMSGDTLDLKKSYEESAFRISGVGKGISKSDYIQAVESIKHLIAEGDFYELNFSYPITANFKGNAYDLYRKMREVNPVPFASYVELETYNLSVCCSSPERFLKKTGSRVILEPIKGTSARGLNDKEDARFRDDLKSEKNEAENLMIVDLVRHDLSAVCKPGSIKVSKLFEIQTFGTVHQLISRVEGTALDNVTPAEIIHACFPMGSMTGAPKIRVMKRIEELENYRRGIYSGAIGYFNPGGDFDFNVVIRSAIVSGGELVYPVGGAITGDSDPEEEWDETAVKSRVLKLVT